MTTAPTDDDLRAAIAAVCGYHTGPDCQHCADTLPRLRADGMTDRQILADVRLFAADHSLWVDATRLRIELRRRADSREQLVWAALGVTPAAVTDEQVRAGADALVRLRTQAPALAELNAEEQGPWLADARAVLEAAAGVGCPCLPGAPRHVHGVGGYRTDSEED